MADPFRTCSHPGCRAKCMPPNRECSRHRPPSERKRGPDTPEAARARAESARRRRLAKATAGVPDAWI